MNTQSIKGTMTLSQIASECISAWGTHETKTVHDKEGNEIEKSVILSFQNHDQLGDFASDLEAIGGSLEDLNEEIRDQVKGSA